MLVFKGLFIYYVLLSFPAINMGSTNHNENVGITSIFFVVMCVGAIVKMSYNPDDEKEKPFVILRH